MVNIPVENTYFSPPHHHHHQVGIIFHFGIILTKDVQDLEAPKFILFPSEKLGKWSKLPLKTGKVIKSAPLFANSFRGQA